MSQDKLNSTDRFVGGLENIEGNLRAGGAISAGDVVHFDGTETGNVPDVSVSDTVGETAAGIALVDAASSGDPVTVAQTGAQVRMNFSGANSASPGDYLVSAGNGSVIAEAGASAGDAVIAEAQSSNAGGEVVGLVTLSGDFHG